jgi:competence protein ComGC
MRVREHIRNKARRSAGFTLIELAVILLVLVILLFLVIPELKTAKKRALHTTCIDNLKQIGLAYRTWPADSGDSYPQAVDVGKYGGSKEWILAGQVSRHFTTMSNELGSPKVLLCPADNERHASTSFDPGFSNTNISYFVGLDAADVEPFTFLSGDRNVVLNSKTPTPGMLILTTNPPTPISWSKDLHVSCGNVGLGDGSVQWWDQKKLLNGVVGQGIATNRIVLP